MIRTIKTKEELVADNAALLEKLDRKDKEDVRIRTVLSELLNSYSYETDSYSSYNNKIKKVLDVQSWEGIAFLIGELKADANYAMIIEQVNHLKMELDLAQQKVKELESPKRDDDFRNKNNHNV